jgi:DNA-binding MarR family transcriptional regulator
LLEFLVLHALRIKGFSGVDTLADIAGLSADAVTPMLSKLAEQGMCKHLEARGLWQLTPAGREHHLALRPEMPAAQVQGLNSHYEPFLEFNLGFKDLCNRWQMRGAEPNDHSDFEFDRARVEELQQLHGDAVVHLRGFAAELPRFETYERRLTIALAKLTDGDTRMFTGVMCGSYHDVWMELHEDLVQLLGVDRHAEGSF